MILEMNPLVCLNNTSEESCKNKLFNPFDFQQIMYDERIDPDLIFLMINPKLLVHLITLLTNLHSALIVFFYLTD